MKTARAAATVVLLAALGLSACTVVEHRHDSYETYPVVVRAPRPPPPLRVEVVPPPRHDHIWVAGHWRWEGNRHHWVDGRWEQKRAHQKWVPHRWEQDRQGHWEEHRGHWRHD